MAFYPYALFLHIVGVLAMFIAIGLEEAALFRLRSAKTTAPVREWSHVMEVVEKVFPLSGVLILVAGLYMVFTVWGWNHAWIDVSLGFLLLTGVAAPTVTSPGFQAIRKAVASAPDGPVSDELHASKMRIGILVMDFLTVGVVCLMTVKPGWIGTLTIMLASLVAALVVVRMTRDANRTTFSPEQAFNRESAREESAVR